MSNVRPCREIYRPKGARISASTNANAAATASSTSNTDLTGLKESSVRVKNGKEGVVSSLSNGNSSTNGSLRSSVSSNESLTFADSSFKEQSQLRFPTHHPNNTNNNNNNNYNGNNNNNSLRHNTLSDSHKRHNKNISSSMIESVSRFNPQDPPAHLIELLNTVEMSIKLRNQQLKQQQQQQQQQQSNSRSVNLNVSLPMSRSHKYPYPSSIESNPQLVSLLEEFKSPEDRSLLAEALDPNKTLSTIQIMKVVRLIHHKALESSANAYPMTWISFFILEKDQSKMFLESLLTCCKEWFSEIESELIARTKLMTSSSNTMVNANSSTTAYHKSWSSFLAFLRELYLVMQQKKNQLISLTSGSGKGGNCDSDGKAASTSASNSNGQSGGHKSNRAAESYQAYLNKQSLALANLLLDASLSLFKIRSNDYNLSLDIESTVSMLRVVGSYLEQDNWSKMQQLMNVFRSLLIDPKTADSLSSMNKKILMEIIEFRACRWLFNQNQQVYYFPYTKF